MASLLRLLQALVLDHNLPEPDYLTPLPGGAEALLAYPEEQAAVVPLATGEVSGWRLFPCDPADPGAVAAAVAALAEALGHLGAQPEPAAREADGTGPAEAESELTPEQRAAVAHPGGPARILAGAGTGKTRVIVARFHHLVARGVRPERILVLTFSREAARSLREAILPGIGAAARLWVSTFHSFCLKVLEGEGLTELRLLQEP
ncbi:MAG: UvrD-helicase domain-containing protein, partial [Bacillota bacterium]